MDLGSLMKAKQAWTAFKANHPKVPEFMSAAFAHGIPEGTVIEVELHYPDGEKMRTNLRVQQSDRMFFELLKSLKRGNTSETNTVGKAGPAPEWTRGGGET